jgi:hypothetical protein
VTVAVSRCLIGFGILLACATPADALGLSCAQAAAIAEAGSDIPHGLLLAIGNVESGRIDSMKQRSPWPWTINTGGVGRFFETADAAILAVQSLRAGGTQSIDIGCFQINLLHHPNAFPDLATGFDPLANALAAARFLVSLHAEFGAWEPAVAAYHSRSDIEGTPYRERVLAAWHGTPPPAAIGVASARIHIWGPNGELGLPAGQSLPITNAPLAGGWRRRLPHVITVSIR